MIFIDISMLYPYDFHTTPETPYLLRQDDYPNLPITVCGGKQFILPLPFPIFDLLHEQFICFFGTDEKLFTQTDFTG